MCVGRLMKGLLELCRPDESAQRVTDIDPARLISQGFEGLLVDLDNTLVPWKSAEVPEDVKRWVEEAKAAGLRLCIVSNTHNPKRLRRIAEELGICWIAHALKPRRASFLSAARKIGCSRERAVVIGDQLLTDIVGGNRTGMYTILVRPMHRLEFFGTKINRIVESWILRLLGLRD